MQDAALDDLSHDDRNALANAIDEAWQPRFPPTTSRSRSWARCWRSPSGWTRWPAGLRRGCSLRATRTRLRCVAMRWGWPGRSSSAESMFHSRNALSSTKNPWLWNLARTQRMERIAMAFMQAALITETQTGDQQFRTR